ncbi:MAG: MarR family transcriptional regulator [Anaerolineae bacterium]|nr:MarR family transcriptional regulator [Anaerolineae bacterium]
MGTHFEGTPEETLALDGYIKLSRAYETVTTRINAHLHDYDLTISQFGVLEAIYHLGPMQPTQLAEKILKSGGNLTLVVSNLVKQGLVTRQQRANDRRCIDVHLTPTGQALVENIMPAHVAGVVETMSVLTQMEQEQLAQLCRKLGLGNLS